MKVKKNYLWIGIGLIGIILVSFLLFSLSKAPPTYPDINSPRPILGNPNASLKVVEFSDYQCPACKTTSDYPFRLINDFGDKISFEYKHFPLSFHQYAFKAAEAAECANDQGKFWEYSELLFEKSPQLSTGDLKNYAKETGLDAKNFSACLDSDAKKSAVEDFIREGYSLQIPGTPTFFVNGKIVESLQYEDIKAEIEEELQK